MFSCNKRTYSLGICLSSIFRVKASRNTNSPCWPVAMGRCHLPSVAVPASAMEGQVKMGQTYLPFTLLSDVRKPASYAGAQSMKKEFQSLLFKAWHLNNFLFFGEEGKCQGIRFHHKVTMRNLAEAIPNKS